MRGYVGLVLGLALGLTACGPNNNTTKNQQSGGDIRPMVSASGETTLRRANSAEPDSLDPHYTTSQQEDNIVGDILLGLTTNGPDARPIPGAAERWETSADGKVWTFHLRDHQWSDGTPVTAQDFIYSWRRILDPKTAAAYASILYVFKNAEAVNAGKMPVEKLGVRAIDDKTIEITLENPAAYLPELMMHMTAFPVPRQAIEAKGKEWSKPGNFVGNGPYTLAEWIPNDHITLKKNPKFYDAANVRIGNVIYYPTSIPEAALKRFRAGELDVLDGVPATQIAWVKANLGGMFKVEPFLATGFYDINTSKKPLDDVRIRQALNLTYDRDTIAYKLLPYGEPPSYSVVPPGVANYPQGVSLDFKDLPYQDRVKRAQDLMRQAGYGPDKHLRLEFSTSPSDDARRVAAAAQQMWAAAYIDVEIRQLESKSYSANLSTGNYDVAAYAWLGDFNDARNFLFLFLSNNDLNYARYKNPAFDALIRQSDQEKDLTKRGTILAQAEALMLKDSPAIPTRFQVTTNVVRPYIRGWVTNIMDKNRTRWLSIDTSAPTQ